jgi:hypothetical protein
MQTFAAAKNRLEKFINQHPDMIGNIERAKAILVEIAEMRDTAETDQLHI